MSALFAEAACTAERYRYGDGTEVGKRELIDRVFATIAWEDSQSPVASRQSQVASRNTQFDAAEVVIGAHDTGKKQAPDYIYCWRWTMG